MGDGGQRRHRLRRGHVNRHDRRPASTRTAVRWPAAETFTAFEPLAIASKGDGYVVAGSRLQDFSPAGNLLAAHITGSAVSPVREIPFEAGDVAG